VSCTPVDVVGGVFLEIGIPRDLLRVDDLAVDERRGLAVAATEIETDAATVEVPAHREARIVRCRQRIHAQASTENVRP
jgi:hypothetical protein